MTESALEAAQIDDTEVQLDSPETIISGRAVVPLRAIADALGAEVEWNAEKGVVELAGGETSITITLDSRRALVNSKRVVLDIPAQLLEGRTMVPASLLYRIPNANVEWSAPNEPRAEASILLTFTFYILLVVFTVIALNALVQLFHLSSVNERIAEVEKVREYLVDRKARWAKLQEELMERLRSGGSVELRPELDVDAALQKYDGQLGDSASSINVLAEKVLFVSVWLAMIACATLAAGIMGGMIHQGMLKLISVEFPAYSDQRIVMGVALTSALMVCVFFRFGYTGHSLRNSAIVFIFATVSSAVIGVTGAVVWSLGVLPIGWPLRVGRGVILAVPLVAMFVFLYGVYFVFGDMYTRD